MKNSKMQLGRASVLGIVVAGAALSGCTSSGQPSASGGTKTASAAAGATTGATTSDTDTAPTTAATATQPTANASVNASVSTAVGAAACTDDELKVTMVSGGAGLGHAAWILVFTNTGSASCSLKGYPGAGVTDRPGKVVLNALRQETGYLGGQYPSPATIVLEPGGAASTVLEWLDAPPNGQAPVGANCPGMDGGKVLVTAPNTLQPTPFPAPEDLCSGFEIHPLVAGAAGRPA